VSSFLSFLRLSSLFFLFPLHFNREDCYPSVFAVWILPLVIGYAVINMVWHCRKIFSLFPRVNYVCIPLYHYKTVGEYCFKACRQEKKEAIIGTIYG
jgi:hypothetical protein